MLRALLSQCIGLTFLLGLSHTSHAQTLAQREFTIQDGLVQSQVDYLFEDSRGYLWIATRGGLNCFNGEKIRTFSGPNQLPGLKIRGIVEDTSGLLYILNQSGVFQFDGVNFKRLDLPVKRYRSIKVDDLGRLWTFTHSAYEEGKLLYIYDLNDGLTELTNPLTKNSEVFRGHRSTFFMEGDTSHFLIGANNESWSILKSSGEVIEKVCYDSVMNYFLTSLCQKNKESTCDPEFDSNFLTGQGIDSVKLLIDLSISPRDPAKKFADPFPVINDKTHELKLINFDKKRVSSYKLSSNEPFYRANIGMNQELWVGTETGLLQIFYPYFLNFEIQKLNLCWNIIGLTDDQILFANHGDELILNGRDSTRLIANNCKPNTSNIYMGNHLLPDGKIIMACSEGLCVFDSLFNCKTYTRRNIRYGHSNTAQHLAVTDNEDLLITATFAGLDQYTISDSSIAFDQYLKFDNEDLSQIYANCLHINNKEDQYWVGHEKGLGIYTKESGNWKYFNIKDKTFPAGDVACIHQDAYGNYWLGTAHGLVFGNEKDGFELLSDPLIFGVVNAIDSFDNEHIILGGSFGICVLNIEAFYEKGMLIGKIFNESNGFTAGEPAENAIYRLHNGSFMVGTQSHPVQLFPEKMDLSVQPLKTRILGINDNLIPFTLDKVNIELPHKVENIRLDFEAIGMYRPSTTRYSYQLNDDDWSDWQEESFVELTDLGSGDHTFSLKAQTPGIDPSRIPVSQVSFTTSVPLWMEPWFPELLSGLLAIAALIIGFMIYLNYRQRQRNLKNAYAIDYLRIQSLQAQMNPHFVFNVLGTLQNMILKADIHKANEQLVNLSTLIRRFLESTVQGNLKEIDSNIKEQSLDKEIELLELYIQFEQIQHQDVFDYSINIHPELDTENYSIPPMLIQPFVENSIKHGLMYKESKGFLSIHFHTDGHRLICTIEDDGVGRRKSQEIQKQSLKLYKSYGTQLVEERVALMNKMDYQINYFIEDLPEGGTRVTLKIG